jgi:hypothetical protein
MSDRGLRVRQTRNAVDEMQIAPLHVRPMTGAVLLQREFTGLEDLDATSDVVPRETREQGTEPQRESELEPVSTPAPESESETEPVPPVAEEKEAEEAPKAEEKEPAEQKEKEPVEPEAKEEEEKKEEAPEKTEEESAEVAEAEAELAAAEGEVVVKEAPAAKKKEEGGGAVGGGIRAWRSGVAKRVAAVPPPQPPSMPQLAVAMQKAASGSQERSAATKEKAPADAKAALPATPEVDAPVQPQPNPVPEAVNLVKAKSDRKLTNQTLPVLQNPPARPGGKPPQRFGPPVLPAEYRTALVPASEAAGEPKAAQTPDQKKAEAIRERARKGPENAEREGAAEALVLVDEGAPQPAPIPPSSKSDIAGVIAIIIAGVEKDARDIVERAQDEAYPNKALVDAFPRFVTELAPDVEQALRTQMEEIREQSGISKEELDQKIADRRAELEKIQQASQGENKDNASANSEAIQKTGQEALDAQAGARSSAEEFIEQQQEAASGSVDPEVIRSKSKRLKRDLSLQVSRQVVQYTQAGERRTKALDEAGQNLVAIYQHIARTESKAIVEEEKTKGRTEQEANAAALPLLQWAQARIDATNKTMTGLRTGASTEAATFQSEIRTAGDQGTELIQQWSDAQVAEHSSWWDRILDLFRNWATRAETDAQAWEEANTAATKEAIVGDLAMMKELQGVNAANIDAAALQQQAGFSDEQRAILKAYFEGPEKGNPLVAVATGIRLRLYGQRKPGLIDTFNKKIIDAPNSEWESVAKIGMAERSDFDAMKIASEAHAAMDQWGTEENRIYTALASLTPIQAAAVRKCYVAEEYGSDLDADLASELSDDELDRAKALLAGDQTEADVSALHYAIEGWGTDEKTIMSVLRNKSPEERKKILERYQAKHGVSLTADLEGDLSSHDLDRANALMDGDTAKADAIAIDQAMHGGVFGLGTEEEEITAVYEQNRAEVEAEATQKGWTTAQVEAEVKRRNGTIAEKYGTYTGGDKDSLLKAYKSEMSGPDLDLALALHDNDIVKADAARLEIERRGFYTDDDAVNKVLHSQRERAKKEVERDLTLEMHNRAELDSLAGRPWDETKWAAERESLGKKIEEDTDKRGAEYMTSLETTYDDKYSHFGKGGLKLMLAFNTSGTEQEEAFALLEQKGKLTPNQEIYFATAGAGTDEERLKKLLAGKSPAEIKKLRDAWNSDDNQYKKHWYGDDSFDDRVLGEFSGREHFDMKMTLKGEPQTPEEMIARAEERAQYETGSGTGLGAAFAGKEQRRLERRIARMHEEKKRIDDLKEKDPKAYDRALKDFKVQNQYFDTAVKDHRAAVDSITDKIVTAITVAVTVIVLVVVIVGTGGAGAALIPALAPAASFLTSAAGVAAVAAATTALTVGTKMAFKGGAYGLEEAGADVAIGAADALVSFATAGLGGKILTRLGGLAKGGAGAKVLAHGLAEGTEGFVQGFAPAITGAVINDDNWRGTNTFGAIMGEGLAGGVMGGLLSGGMAGGGQLASAFKTAKVKKSAVPLDVLAHRGTPAERKALFQEFEKANPGKSYKAFLQELDAGTVAKQASAQEQRQAQREMRKHLLEGIPPAQRKQFAGTRIDVLSDAEFDALTRSKKGQAAVLIEGGKTRVIMRESADPKVLREEGHHLLQTLDPALFKKMKKLDEKVMKQWDRLDLDTKLKLLEKKLDLEIDGQHRLIKDLKSALAEAGDDASARKSLLAQLDDAGENLHNLTKRLDDVTSISSFEKKAIKSGHLEPPEYLDQPPRLFSKKERPAGAYKRADPEAPRQKVDDYSFDEKKLAKGDEVYQVGDEWEEIKDDLSKRVYREVEVTGPPPDRVKKIVREEILMPDGSWRPRGSEAVESGAIGEEASKKLIAEQTEKLKAQNVTRHSLGGGAGAGFDNTHFDFSGPPLSAKMVIVEVKNYPGRYVPLADFTAIQGKNATTNFQNIKAMLKDAQLNPTSDLRKKMTLAEIDAALKAIDDKNVRIEIHLGDGTKLGTLQSGTVLKSLQADWKARGFNVDINTEGLSKSLIDEASKKVIARDAIGITPKFHQMTGAAEKLGIAKGPFKTIVQGVFADDADKLLSLKVLKAEDVTGPKLQQTAEEVVNLLNSPFPVPPKNLKKNVSLLLDTSVLGPIERKAFQDALDDAMRKANAESAILKRLHDFDGVP